MGPSSPSPVLVFGRPLQCTAFFAGILGTQQSRNQEKKNENDRPEPNLHWRYLKGLLISERSNVKKTINLYEFDEIEEHE